MNFKYNKKAQNITEPYTLILILVMITLISVSFFEFGADYAGNPENNLDNASLLYIYNHSGFNPANNITSSDTTDPFFTSQTDNEGNLKDFALEFQFYREQSSSVRNILQDIWNVPSFFVEGLGLDSFLWKTIINIWNTILWTLILYAIYRFLRARIK